MVNFTDAFFDYRNMVVALLEDVNAFVAVSQLDNSLVDRERGWSPLCDAVAVLIMDLKANHVTRYRLGDMLEKAINKQYPPMESLFAELHNFVVLQSPTSWAMFTDRLRKLCDPLMTIVQKDSERVAQFTKILEETTLSEQPPVTPYHEILKMKN